MADYYTSGQVAKQLRVSVSTLKRWVADAEESFQQTRNSSGWMLFSDIDMNNLKRMKINKKRSGKTFSRETLEPIISGIRRERVTA